MKVNVLGTEYEIKKAKLQEYDGLCDWSTQQIFIGKRRGFFRRFKKI